MTATGHIIQTHATGLVPDTVRPLLRLEGLAILVAGLIAYDRLGGDWLWLVPALLLPDLSAIGYLAGPSVGSLVYNLVHNWALGLAVLGAGLLWAIPWVALAGVVLIAHVGMDRLAGYGLKHPSGFKDTHMQRA
jgi:hypothetical protein